MYQHQPTACTSRLSDYHRAGQKRAASCVVAQQAARLATCAGDALAKERPAVVFTAARHERHRPHRIYEGGRAARLRGWRQRGGERGGYNVGTAARRWRTAQPPDCTLC